MCRALSFSGVGKRPWMMAENCSSVGDTNAVRILFGSKPTKINIKTPSLTSLQTLSCFDLRNIALWGWSMNVIIGEILDRLPITGLFIQTLTPMWLYLKSLISLTLKNQQNCSVLWSVFVWDAKGWISLEKPRDQDGWLSVLPFLPPIMIKTPMKAGSNRWKGSNPRRKFFPLILVKW